MCKMLELTLTCFACGMPSSSLWARRVKRKLPGSGSSSGHGHGQGHQSPLCSAPFYSQLEGKDCPPGAVVNEDGTINLCAFCFALLDSASRGNVEGARVAGIGEDRVRGREFDEEVEGRRSPTSWKFVCGVCGVETYRKRVRALPLQKFQFLSKTRKPGSISITLGDSECAVVCLDCSETLWTQSDEYDRWGLPEHKRHFNWLARPPPPEDSEEANLARLPSGKAQLPRTPPTEPILPSTNINQHQRDSEFEMHSQMQRNIRYLRQKKAKSINRPMRSSSASSNSNSSNSNFPMDIDIQIQNQPMAKRQKTVLQNGSPPTWLTMDQSLPHMESLDLSTRNSQSPSSSQQSFSDLGSTPSLIQFPFSQQYPSPLVPLSQMSYLTYSAPVPHVDSPLTSPMGKEYGHRNPSPTTSVTSHSPNQQNNYGPAYQGSSGRQRSTPIPILTSYHGHLQLQNCSMGPEFRTSNSELLARYSHERIMQHPQEVLHRPQFVYTARPPPTTIRETDSAYFRPFLSRIPTRIIGQRLQIVNPSGHQRPHLQFAKKAPLPQNTSHCTSQSHSKEEILSSSSKSRRCSVPVAMASRSRPRGGQGTGQIALLPKKRRSWDHLNGVVEGGPDSLTVLKYTPRQKQTSNSKQMT